MNFQSVLIVTYGRSGSTLLQGLLNSVDGCVVRGENHNLVYRLFQAYTALIRSREEVVKAKSDGASPTNPWFGAPMLDDKAFVADIAALVRRQLLGDRDPATVQCLGFKEIRYPGLEGLPDYLTFLAWIFPQPAFVLLTRDHAAVANSAWWRNRDPAAVNRELTQFEEAVGRWAEGRSDVFRIDYDDLAGHGPAVPALFDFLGAPYERANVDQVLSTPHSYSANDKPTAAAGKYVVVEFVPDPLPPTAASLDGLAVGGVAVVSGPGIERAQLRAFSGDRALPLDWGLPSPVMATRHADIPRAANARFRVDVSSCRPGDELQFDLVAPDGSQKPLGALPLPAPEAG